MGLPGILKIQDLREQDNIKELVNRYETKYNQEAKDSVSKVEFFTKEFNLNIYEYGVRGLLEQDVNKDLVQEYLIEASKQYKIYLAKYFNGIDVVKVHRMNDYPSLASNDIVKYIGEDTELYLNGNIYRINEVQNWFHNKYDIGYYVTNEDYDGFDSDYCVFYPIESIEKSFEIVK